MYMDDTIGARKMTFRALFVPEKKILIEYRYRSDTAYRCTKITKVSGKIVEIDHYETHPEHRVVVRDRPIYKKVLGSRRYLATVFWSLSIRYERHAAQACLR